MKRATEQGSDKVQMLLMSGTQTSNKFLQDYSLRREKAFDSIHGHVCRNDIC